MVPLYYYKRHIILPSLRHRKQEKAFLKKQHRVKKAKEITHAKV